MHSTTLLTSALALLAASANARITGFYAPKSVAVDSTVKLQIRGEDYIQSIQDVAIAFGIQHGKHPTPESLGTLLGSKYLGPGKHPAGSPDRQKLTVLVDNSNVDGNITASVHIPSGTQEGKTTVTASLFSLLGALYNPDLDTFQVTVNVGESTSSEYVFSHIVTDS